MRPLYQLALRAIPTIFWVMLIITTISMLIELAPKQAGWAYWDKLQHMLVFMMLLLLGANAYLHKYYLAIGLMLYGAIIEVLQSMFTLTRHASIDDWLADVVGICMGLLIFALLQKIVPTIAYKQLPIKQ